MIARGRVDIKPLSVNRAWQGRRFKTYEYEQYERFVILNLPPVTLPEPPYCVQLSFGISNASADVDNPIKPILDILQKKYRFNDKLIERLIIDKVRVKKGKEYVEFTITSNNIL